MIISFFKKGIILTLIITLLMTSFSNIVFSARMTSSSYKIQSDSVNFAGGNSSSASYVTEDTVGEIGTGDIQSSNYKNRAGYQQYVVAVVPSSSPSPSGGASGGSRAPLNVTDFVAQALEGAIYLSWRYPALNNIKSVRIVRSDKFFPANINDGEIIFEGSTNSVIDNNVKVGVKYYYAIFALDIFGRYSSGVLAQATVPADEFIPAPKVPEDPFIDIPPSSNIDPIINALTLLDFDFIQDGIKIEHALDKIVIDGRKDLTILLEYTKVPEILKTIAMTFVDPDDSTKIFTFLLRVNEDKTAYEATIGPLGRSGEYKISTIILDYKNQSLKRLDGILKASLFGPVEELLRDRGIFINSERIIPITLSIIFILLIIFLIIRKFLRKKEEKYDV